MPNGNFYISSSPLNFAAEARFSKENSEATQFVEKKNWKMDQNCKQWRKKKKKPVIDTYH